MIAILLIVMTVLAFEFANLETKMQEMQLKVVDYKS